MRARLRRCWQALLAASATALWRPDAPLAPRAHALRLLFGRQPSGGALSRQMDALAHAAAAAGAAALRAQPQPTMALIARLQRHGGRPVVIAGDSHSRLYVLRGRRGGEWLLPLHHLATGASARGLGRGESRSGQGAQIAELAAAMDRARLDAPLLLVFGQVDAEFVHTFKRLACDPPAAPDAQAWRAFTMATVAAYVDYAAALPRRPTLASIFPPALSDEAWRDGYLNAHIAALHGTGGLDELRERLARAEIADWRSRTADHRSFNGALEPAARERELGWLDATADLPMSDGVVSPQLLGRAGGRDHHLDAPAVRPYLAARLWRLLDGTADDHG